MSTPSTAGKDGLSAYLQKQREAQRIAEEIEELESDEIVRISLKIKHELEALMADYDLDPKQLVETTMLMFDLAEWRPLSGKVDETSPSVSTQPAESEKTSSDDAQEPVASVAGVVAKKGRPKDKPAATAKQGQSKRKVSASKGGETPAGKSMSTSRVGRSPAKRAEDKSSGTRIIRRGRKAMVYENPHTGQRVVAKGLNHRTLNEWRSEYGDEAVASWGRPQQPE